MSRLWGSGPGCCSNVNANVTTREYEAFVLIVLNKQLKLQIQDGDSETHVGNEPLLVTVIERAEVDESVEKEVGICMEVLFWLHHHKNSRKSDCLFNL